LSGNGLRGGMRKLILFSDHKIIKGIGGIGALLGFKGWFIFGGETKVFHSRSFWRRLGRWRKDKLFFRFGLHNDLFEDHGLWIVLARCHLILKVANGLLRNILERIQDLSMILFFEPGFCEGV